MLNRVPFLRSRIQTLRMNKLRGSRSTGARGTVCTPTSLQISTRNIFTEKLVDNTGSIARDILATERTFLAWARTGLGFVGAGSALFAAYHRHESVIQEDIVPACAVLLVNGSYLLLFATRRYLRVIDAILKHNKFPINVGGTLSAVIVTSMGTLSSMALVARAEWNAETIASKKNILSESEK